jgi:hypothetical protein
MGIAMLLLFVGTACDAGGSRSSSSTTSRASTTMTQSTFWLPATSSTVIVQPPVSRSCRWRPAEVNDAASTGFVATVIGITNVTGVTCRRPSARSIVASTASRRRVAVTAGSFPVRLVPPYVTPGDRVELTVTSVSDCDGRPSLPIARLEIVLDDGQSIAVPVRNRLDACRGLGHSDFGAWD